MSRIPLIVLSVAVVLAQASLVDACRKVQRASGDVCEASGYTPVYSYWGNLKTCVKRGHQP